MKNKTAREKGKISLRTMFQELKEGDRVAVIKERSVPSSFPDRMAGKTGVISGKRGRCFIIKLNDYNAKKTYIVQPIHLKKLK